MRYALQIEELTRDGMAIATGEAVLADFPMLTRNRENIPADTHVPALAEDVARAFAAQKARAAKLLSPNKQLSNEPS